MFLETVQSLLED